MSNLEVIKLIILLKSMPELGSNNLYKLLQNLEFNLQDIIKYSPLELKALGFNDKQINYIKNPNWDYANKQLEIAKKITLEY